VATMYFEGKEKTYVLLDIEGNSAKTEEERKITQFAALIFHNGEIEELNLMNRNVNYINPYVRRMTHISVHKCKNIGCTERRLVEEVHKLLSTCDLIYAYGCDFDKNILALMFRKYHLPKLNVKWIDVIEDVKKYLCPSKNKLSIAASEYGFNEVNYHNALVDCYATLHLMKTIENIEKITTK
jgi:DNA polymerase III alpha subunit (gram-positive type)